MKNSPKRFINVFILAMLNLSVMASLRNLPIIAEYGLQSVGYYFLVALIFLIPAALISAELATGWSQTGGIYIWVREAFGPGWGFFAVWMQWIHNATWFPAILSFSAGALAYLFNPELAGNKIYILSVVLISFWGFTIFNYFGLKTSALFSSIGVIVGTIFPGILLISLGLFWFFGGYPLNIPFSFEAMIPQIDSIQDIVFLSGLFLAFGGLEVSAVHVREVQNPQKSFPKAISLAGSIALFLYVCGALSIAVMIPKEKISVLSGLMETFRLFFTDFNMSWMIFPIGLMIIIGAVGELNAWIIGPVRALHTTTKHGDLPPFFQKLNIHGMPAHLLFLQAIIVSITSCVFLFMPTTGSAFWILSALSAQLYLLMYILMFLSAIKLRYSHPHVIRSYRVPFQNKGIWIISILGILSSCFGFIVSFIPPAQIKTGNLLFYEGFLSIGLSVMCFIPYIIYRLKDPNWVPKPPSKHPFKETLHS